jgi:hypothetical protein
VRHICRYEDGFFILARGVLSDYRWLLAVCSFQSLAFASSQYGAVVNCVRDWRENRKCLRGNDSASAFELGFIRDLESIAEILRLCVPPAAVEFQGNDEEGPCPVHGKWSVGDPGLAHQLVGRLGFVSSDDTSLVLEVGGGNGGCSGGGNSGVFSLIDMLVGSIKRCADVPWLVPVNRFYFEADCRGLAQVVRGGASCCLSFVLGNAECVKFRGWEVISVYDLENGELIRELHDEGAGWIRRLAVASEGCGVKPEEVGYVVGLDKVWLAAGHDDGSVRIFDVETGRCVTTLHPMVCPHYSESCGVSMAPDRRRVVYFTKPHPDSLDNVGLHVWELSSDGAQERYEYVDGCKNSFGFEVASAALLYQDKSKGSSVEQCSSRVVRFERSLKSDRRMDLLRFLATALEKDDCWAARRALTRWSMRKRLILCFLWELRAILSPSRRRAISWSVVCRLAHCEDRVLIVAVNGGTKVVTVLDAQTSEIIREFRKTTYCACRRSRARTNVFWLSRGIGVE